MDFSTMVKWHIQWLTDIMHTMEYHPGDLIEQDVARNDRCEFGMWLSSHRAEYADFPEFLALVEAHDTLHHSAATAVKLAHSGHIEEAKKYLSPGGDFVALSKELLDCAGRFFRKINS